MQTPRDSGLDLQKWPATRTDAGLVDSRRRGALVAWAMVLLIAAGCAPRPSAHAPAESTTGPAGGPAFQLDSGASEIWLFLHADGPLAKVGHAHVITHHALRGTIWLPPQAEQSGCEVQIPVQSFIVDDPKERATAGAEYAEPLDEAARSGTRDHMLGDKQLNATQYPVVSLQCRHITKGAQGATVELTVTVRDHTSQLSVPVQWQHQGNTLRAEGELSFTQTALGLEPYSLLFGALRVSDEIRAHFRFVANAPTR
jgi:YceI-like domain